MANPVDVTIVGMALNDFGLSANDTIAGIGLITFGFLWPCDGIWNTSENSITTTWTSCTDGGTTIETCTD